MDWEYWEDYEYCSMPGSTLVARQFSPVINHPAAGQSVPLVDITPSMRGSIEVASSSARANALKIASNP